MPIPRYYPDSLILRMPIEAIEEMQRLVKSGQRIHAIKLLRKETGCGLREAKEAIEARFDNMHRDIAGVFSIKPLVSVKSVRIDLGQGEVDLCMEDLQMMTLVNMNEIGIAETHRILQLHELLKAWESNSGHVNTGHMQQDKENTK